MSVKYINKLFTLTDKTIELLDECANYAELSKSAVVREGIKMFHKEVVLKGKKNNKKDNNQTK